MRVACCQLVCRPGDVAGNLEQVLVLSAGAAQAGARFALFAEGALTGYVFTPENQARALRFDGPEAARLAEASRRLRIGLAVGTLDRSDEGVHVAQWIFLPDGRKYVQYKHNLTDTEVGTGVLRGPRERTLFDFEGLRFAVLICADNGIENIDSELQRAGVQVLLSPCAGGGRREWIRRPEELRDPEVFRAYAECLTRVCFVGNSLDRNLRGNFAMMAVNLCGDDGIGSYHPGHSSISDHDGRLGALLPGEYVASWLEPRFITAEIW